MDSFALFTIQDAILVCNHFFSITVSFLLLSITPYEGSANDHKSKQT